MRDPVRLQALATSGALVLPVIAAALLVAAPVVGDAPAATLRIVELVSDPAAGAREFLELANEGTSAIDLAGWKLKDAPTASGSVNTFTFPTWVLAGGARVVVWGGSPTDGAGPHWSATSAWNNAGDVASLLDPAGNLVGVVAYGSATYRPLGWESTPASPAPDKGKSLTWKDGAWTLAEPTPGRGDAGVGGVLQVDVANLAPTAALQGPATAITVGAPVALTILAGDGNGPSDVESWTLADGATLAAGTTGGSVPTTVTAPLVPGPWALALTVTDKTGLEATAQLVLDIRPSGLRVALADAPAPLVLGVGASTAQTAIVAQITNDGAAAAPVRVDVSPLSGAASRPAEGILEIGWTTTVAGETNTTWIPYTGGWMSIATLEPGDSAALRFRVLAEGLPPGTYGTSFSVVAV